ALPEISDPHWERKPSASGPFQETLRTTESSDSNSSARLCSPIRAASACSRSCSVSAPYNPIPRPHPPYHPPTHAARPTKPYAQPPRSTVVSGTDDDHGEHSPWPLSFTASRKTRCPPRPAPPAPSSTTRLM